MQADKSFILTSTTFEGRILFKYDSKGYLQFFELEGELSEKQVLFLFSNFPFSLPNIHELKQQSKTLIIKEVILEITFEMFWDKYNYKEDKAEAMKLWAKMDQTERAMAYNYIPIYSARQVANQVGKKYPKTYLRQKPWIT